MTTDGINPSCAACEIRGPGVHECHTPAGGLARPLCYAQPIDRPGEFDPETGDRTDGGELLDADGHAWGWPGRIDPPVRLRAGTHEHELSAALGHGGPTT